MPIANLAIPTIVQSVIHNQVMRIPVSIPMLKYYDEYKLDYKFSGSPDYVPDSL